MDRTHGTTPWECIVIGASAAGLSAALMLGRAGRTVLVVDAGTPRSRFAAHMHGVLGHEGRAPSELTADGRAECAAYGIQFLKGEILQVRSLSDSLELTSNHGEALRTRALIVATGVTDTLPPIQGLEGLWGTRVLHCPYCHGWEVRGKRIAVLATSPGSIHQARLLRQWSEEVIYLSSLGGELAQADQLRLEARGVRVEPRAMLSVHEKPFKSRGIDGSPALQVDIEGGGSHQVDAIFTAPNLSPNDQCLTELHLTRDPENGYLVVDHTGRTSNPRVWAAGNVVSPYANVPMSMGAGSLAGGAVNGWLTEEDFEEALADRSTSGQ